MVDEELAISLHEGMWVLTADDVEVGTIKNVWTPTGATEGPAADRAVEPGGGGFPPRIDQPSPGGDDISGDDTILGAGAMEAPERVADTSSAVGVNDANPIVDAPTESYFQVDRRFAPDWYVPASAVDRVASGTVVLTLDKHQADDQEWGLKPDWLAE